MYQFLKKIVAIKKSAIKQIGMKKIVIKKIAINIIAIKHIGTKIISVHITTMRKISTKIITIKKIVIKQIGVQIIAIKKFATKIIAFQKIYGNKLLAMIYLLRIIFVTLLKQSYLKLKQYYHSIKKAIQAKWLFIKDRLIQYYYLTRLNKPAGILLLLWPVLGALWIAADGPPDLDILIIFMLGVVIMRSAGCVFNDLIDRDLDRHVSRTHDRPITSGKVTPREAIDLTIILLIAAIILVLNLNIFTCKLSFVAVFFAAIYPFMKRITYLPQIFLGLTFAWSIPMAFAAQTNSIPNIAWLLFIMTVLWAVVYDTMYAMVDKADDIKIGIKSTAILFDDADQIIIASIQLMILFTQILIGTKLELGKYYFIGIGVASLLSVYQQYLIKDKITENCFRAFLNNQWYGMIVFAGIYLNYMFRL